MSRKSKIEPIEKVKIVELYLKGEIGLNEAVRLSGNCSYQQIRNWDKSMRKWAWQDLIKRKNI